MPDDATPLLSYAEWFMLALTCLGLFGLSWFVVVGLLWLVFGLVWLVFGLFSRVLACFGVFWPVLACFGLFWPALACFGFFGLLSASDKLWHLMLVTCIISCW